MKALVRSLKRMRMTPMEKMVDNIRHKEFKKAGKLAKKEVYKLEEEGREFVDDFAAKLSSLDYEERVDFFDELAKRPEKLKDMVYNQEDFFEDRCILADLLGLAGGVLLLIGLCKLVRKLIKRR